MEPLLQRREHWLWWLPHNHPSSQAGFGRGTAVLPHLLLQRENQSTHLWPFAMKLKNETSISTTESIRPFKRTRTLFPSKRDFTVPRVRLFFVLFQTNGVHLTWQIPSHQSRQESHYWWQLKGEHKAVTDTNILSFILNLVVLNLHPSHIFHVHERVIFVNEHDRSATFHVLWMKIAPGIDIPLKHHRISSRWYLFTLGIYVAVNVPPARVHGNGK